MTMWRGRARRMRPILVSLFLPLALALGAGTTAAAPPAPFGVSPSSLAFGDVTVNTTSTQSFTVSTGRKSAVLYIEFSNGPYSVTGGDCLTTYGMQVPAATSCQVTITFAPVLKADWSGTLTVFNCATWFDFGGLPRCDRTHGSLTMPYTGAGVDPAP